MEFLKEKLGEELYATLVQKLDGLRLIPESEKTIPKHRFDCINMSLKEAKASVIAQSAENERLKKEIADFEIAKNAFEREKLDMLVQIEIALLSPKNLKAVRALIDYSGIKTDGDNVSGLAEQLKNIREQESYLFNDLLPAYVMLPLNQEIKIENDISKFIKRSQNYEYNK